MTNKEEWEIINITNIFILKQELYEGNLYKIYLKDLFHGKNFIHYNGLCECEGSSMLIEEKRYFHNQNNFNSLINGLTRPSEYRIRIVNNIQKEEKEMISDIKKGVKFDEGKNRYDLIDSYALDQLTKIYTFGSKKYEDNNWRSGFKWGRIFGALMRHSWAFWRGEDLDKESGLPHMAHAAWCCFTLINFSEFGIGEDDRIKQNFKEHK